MFRFAGTMWLLFTLWIRFAVSSVSQDEAYIMSSGRPATNGNAVNYADVRLRVKNSYAEKANEIGDTIALLQDISRDTLHLKEQISAQCAQ